MKNTKKLRDRDIYRDALINIWKLGGICWDGNRKCSDAQHVARRAIKTADPDLFEATDFIPYVLLDVTKSGRIKGWIKKRKLK